MIGFVIGAGLGAAILGAAIAHRKWEDSRAVTIEDKERLVLKRLAQKYRGQGDAEQLARDHLFNMSQIEEFKRIACREYVRNGTSLLDMKRKFVQNFNQAARSVHGNSPEGLRIARTFELALMSTPADEIFTTPEAKAKWQKELEDSVPTSIERDRNRDHAIEKLFAAGNRI